jgi:hypothetical protein
MADEPAESSEVVSSTPLADSDKQNPQLSDRMALDRHVEFLKLRKAYAYPVLYLSVGQVAVVNIFFGCNAVARMPWFGSWSGLPFHVSDDLFKVFAISVFSEVIALCFIVTRHLFPGEKGLIEDLASFLPFRKG